MHRSLALALVYSAKALTILGQNIATINMMNGGPYPKNNVMTPLLGDSKMVWPLAKVTVANEVLGRVMGPVMCPSSQRS